MTWYVDIPDSIRLDGPWKCLGEFNNKEEAISFVQKQFGADGEGRIDLVTWVDDEEEADEEEEGETCPS